MRVVAWVVVCGLIVLALAIGMTKAHSRPFNLCWNLSTSETNHIVMEYGFYWAVTNNPGMTTYFGQSPDGHTNMWFDTTNLMPNPCYITGQTVGTNWAASVMSAPFLFDTNNYPLTPVTNSTAIMLPLAPMTGINVKTN